MNGVGDQLIYRYIPEVMVEDGTAPNFNMAMRFLYDRRARGAPTLAKLAEEAVNKLVCADYGGHVSVPWQRGCRVWIWCDDGTFVGSVVVKARIETRFEAQDDTIQRAIA